MRTITNPTLTTEGDLPLYLGCSFYNLCPSFPDSEANLSTSKQTGKIHSEQSTRSQQRGNRLEAFERSRIRVEVRIACETKAIGRSGGLILGC